MHLSALKLTQFKSYKKADYTFSKGINLIVGPNGSGKTNLLDAIHFLANGRGAFNHVDSQHIHWGEGFFFLKGTFEIQNKSYDIRCSLERGKKKTLACDEKEYQRIGDHYGRFPLVLIAPYDTDLIREGNEIRRKFFDSIIAQIDQSYLQSLYHYQKYLSQRNESLKSMHLSRRFDATLIEAYERELLPLNRSIAQRRQQFIRAFLPIFSEKHQEVAQQERASVKITYQSEVLEGEFPLQFRGNLSRDRMLQRTEKGIHRDKYLFEIERKSLKKFGSQGQQKTFILGLKLAQYELLRLEKEENPILLLDDIFDKLDQHRTEQLLALVHSQAFEQVFITDASPERAKRIFKNSNIEMELFSTKF